MIKVRIEKKENKIYAFEVSGHAGYASHGEDIICAAISMLVINTINSIDYLTDDEIILEEHNQQTGHIWFKLNIETKPYSGETDVLLKSLELGIKSAIEQYGSKYIEMKEVH